MTRIALVEDHTLFRQSLVRTLDAEADLAVVGEAGHAEEAIGVIERERPDVVLMDITLPGVDGIDVAMRVRQSVPSARVVFLTMHDDERSIRRAMSTGADGFVPKTATSQELLHAVRVVARGDSYLSPSVARRIVNVMSAGAGRLTDRDVEILQLLAEGLRPGEVAQRLFLSTKTVKNYCSRIYAEMGVSTATQAVVTAYRRGILSPPTPG